tara:strand:+ start:422 stop:1837 length:1416 start_codon:yes stop_codon:yes gene_type:complete
MATKAERDAQEKKNKDKRQKELENRNAGIKKNQQAKLKQQQQQGQQTIAGIKTAVGNTETKRKKDNLDKQISLGKIKVGKGKPQTDKEIVKTARQSASQRIFGDGPVAVKSNNNTNSNNNNNKPNTKKTNKPKKQVRNIGKSVVSGIKSDGLKTSDKSRTITGGILTNKAGVSGKTTVGEIRSNRENQNRTDGGKLNSYKQGDKRATYDAISKEELANMTPQQRRIAKRTNKRLDRKEGRKNDRARNVAIRRGLSPQQAKDFMQNRRNRLNQAMGEFGKGLMGKQQNLGNIEDRMYRKKGTGTLQNMKAEDGSTYDATAPYQGVGPNRTGRGLARTYYDKITKAKPLDLKPTIPLSIESQNDTENQNKTTKVIENNLEGNQGNNLSTKLYSDMPAAERAAARAYNIDKHGTHTPTAEGKANNTFTYSDGNRQEGLDAYNERLKKASRVSPISKLDDRSTMQGNMMSAKGRR